MEMKMWSLREILFRSKFSTFPTITIWQINQDIKEAEKKQTYWSYRWGWSSERSWSTKKAGVVIETEVKKDAEKVKPSEVITDADKTKNVQESMEVEHKMETGVTMEYNKLENAKENKNDHGLQKLLQTLWNKWLGLALRTR